MLTDEGCLEEVRPPEHLVHGADCAELEPPILDLEDAGDVGHEDDRERARQRLDGGRALARLHLVHAAHRQLPQRADLDHEEQRHRALREQHEEEQVNHTDRPAAAAPLSHNLLRFFNRTLVVQRKKKAAGFQRNSRPRFLPFFSAQLEWNGGVAQERRFAAAEKNQKFGGERDWRRRAGNEITTFSWSAKR